MPAADAPWWEQLVEPCAAALALLHEKAQWADLSEIHRRFYRANVEGVFLEEGDALADAAIRARMAKIGPAEMLKLVNDWADAPTFKEEHEIWLRALGVKADADTTNEVTP